MFRLSLCLKILIEQNEDCFGVGEAVGPVRRNGRIYCGCRNYISG
jgi:hypothetical protein